MPNPTPYTSGDGCCVHAGILQSHGGDKSKATLTKGYPESATTLFIDAVKKELSEGNSMPEFPCGDPNPPIDPSLLTLIEKLDDEAIFPEFHKNILGYYKDIMVSLDVESEFNLLPICDPVAFSLKNFNAPFDIPDLASFVPYFIPNPALLASAVLPNLPAGTLPIDWIAGDLAALIANIKVPPELPKMPISLAIPSPEFPGLFEFHNALILNFPKFMTDLIASMPDLIIKIATGDIKAAFGEICEKAQPLFGEKKDDPQGNPQDIVMRAARKVLAKKATEATVVHAMAKTIGSAPGGVVGIIAKQQGYDPPPASPGQQSSQGGIRQRLSNAISGVYRGLSWHKDGEKYAKFLYPAEFANKKGAVAQAAAALQSSCGITARAILQQAGAYFVFNGPRSQWLQMSKQYTYVEQKEQTTTTKAGKKINYDYFNDEYLAGTAVQALNCIAYHRNAWREPCWPGVCHGTIVNGKKVLKPVTELPVMKVGDIIIQDEEISKGRAHVIVVAQDYNPGDSKLVTFQGGQSDPGNIDVDGKSGYVRKGGILCTAMCKITYYKNKSEIPKGAPPYTAYPEGHLHMGPKDVGGKFGTVWILNTNDIRPRPIMSILDSEKIIAGGTPASAKTGKDAINPSIGVNDFEGGTKIVTSDSSTEPTS